MLLLILLLLCHAFHPNVCDAIDPDLWTQNGSNGGHTCITCINNNNNNNNNVIINIITVVPCIPPQCL